MADLSDTLVPIHVTAIADLPDSLKPRAFALDTMPQPITIQVPRRAGGVMSITNQLGEEIHVNLEPPVVKPLRVLQNEEGDPILDHDGKPIVMGDGGKSNFTNFTTDDGLAQDAIKCSAMDKEGNLWFGTYGGGVSKYDGNNFINFTTAQGLANNRVMSIIEDKTGNMWFGTYGGGVSKYDGKRFVNYSTAQGLANNSVFCIAEDKTGKIWFGTFGGGVSVFDGNRFRNFTITNGLASDSVICITEDKTGDLWFGTTRGAAKYNGISFVNYTIHDGLASDLVNCVNVDSNGDIWFGTAYGVSKYNGKSLDNFTTIQGLTKNSVSCITEDNAGNLWFGTNRGGVSKYDGRFVTNFTSAQGLASDIVLSITEDKSGNIWFGTYGAGVSKYDGKPFTIFTTEQGLAENTVGTIAEDKAGNLWFGTDFGVSRYDGKTFTNFTPNQGLPHQIVLSITEDKTGNLWFGTDGGGVSKYDGNCFQNYSTSQGLAHEHVMSILEDKEGNLWFGTFGGGVSKYNGKGFINYTTSQGLVNNVIFSMMEDKAGNLWFGTNGGVTKYDGVSFVNFTTSHGLANNNVYSLAEDSAGNLWFGTEEGLSMIRARDIGRLKNLTAKANEMPRISSTIFKRFKIEDGLPDNFVTQVMKMPDGKMCIGTNLGITLFKLSDDGNKLTGIENYNSGTGYPVKDINVGKNGLFLDRKGIIWAGTGSEKTGLVRFDYNALQKNTNPPNVVIQSVKVKNENISWYELQSKGSRKSKEDSAISILQEYIAFGKTCSSLERNVILKRFGNIQFDGITKFYPLPENLVLPYEHNQIAFQFAAIETGRPFLVRYQYKLDGYDNEWNPVTSERNATFGNISEGTYTFKLRAQGANGVWSKPIRYTFKVLPPWYRTWWAELMYALLFLLALRIFSKWRERRLRAEKERLERTVEERTEELVQKNKIVEEQKAVVEKEKKRSDDLLLNILPEEVAEELKTKGYADAKQFEEVTVLFTDFKDFTKISAKMSPKELVEEIHTCFKAFDIITAKYGIEKIKTIGDSYMCAGGLPIANKTHASDVVSAGLEIQQFISMRTAEMTSSGMVPFQIRIGIHTGPVVAGIVGIKKFAYDIWGDTVNTASRMENSGEAGKVNISGATYKLIKEKFACVHRGKIQAKGKGEIDMYFVEKRNEGV